MPTSERKSRQFSPASNENQRHAHIPTPSWRRFTPSQHDSSTEQSLSSDDTSDEAYIKRHQPLALEERSRWAGPLPDNQDKSISNNSFKNKSNSTKPIRPLYPTPLHCHQIVRQARKAYLKDRCPHLSNQTKKSSVKIRQIIHTPAKICASIERDFATHVTAIQAASRKIAKPKKIYNNENQTRLPPVEAAAAIVAAATTEVLNIADQFQEKTRCLRNAMAVLARHTGAHVPVKPPFRAIEQALACADADDAQQLEEKYEKKSVSEKSFSDCIRDNIDPVDFRILKSSFNVRDGYCLDGSRKLFDEQFSKNNFERDSYTNMPELSDEEDEIVPNFHVTERKSSRLDESVMIDVSGLIPSYKQTNSPKTGMEENHDENSTDKHSDIPKPTPIQKIKMRTPPRRKFPIRNNSDISDEDEDLKEINIDNDSDSEHVLIPRRPAMKKARPDADFYGEVLKEAYVTGQKPSLRKRRTANSVDESSFYQQNTSASQLHLKRKASDRPSLQHYSSRRERKSFRIVECKPESVPSGSSAERSGIPVSKFIFTPSVPSGNNRERPTAQFPEETEDIELVKSSSVVELDDDL